MSVRKLIKESVMNIENKMISYNENKIVKICHIDVIDKNIARRQ
jgi:hypothetical protein